MMDANDIETTPTEETPAPAPAKTVKQNGAKGNKMKAKSKKIAKKPAKKAKSLQAQSGPAMDLPFDKMNKNEQKIVKTAYSAKGERKPYSIKDFMTSCKLKSSPVRNALRRPVRGGWLEKAERGTYRLTEKARKRGLKGA